ncbi:GGDEF domain [Shewanella denitrificans OS217]|uniref:diguanylate cyclase n=1 Tax=Shewanella denitrificans (strain OS217 / ATCC BAA-1090 / DSM 15013) TaxID=318161 RepID=Q12S41_SHEDO|nr:GGDEF domain-containing protein [Shewanella denitrificans]ABE53735.1 GGDEF domain [Shewanella denitrificans OS217]
MHEVELDKTHKLRAKVLIGTCGLLGMLGLLLGVINILFIGLSPVLAGLQLGYALVSFWLMQRALNDNHKPWEAHLYVYGLTAIVMFAVYVARLESFMFCWALILPILYLLMLGKQTATLPASFLFIFVLIDISIKSDVMPWPMILNFSCSYALIWLIAYVYENNRERSENELQTLALLDPLTQHYNRLALSKRFQSLSQTSTLPMCILLLDLDYFKVINDTYGHEAGDIVLKACAKQISSIAGYSDTFRVGGEEFCVLVQAEHANQAVELAESIRKLISDTEFLFENQNLAVTVSVGVATFEAKMTLSNLLAKADKQLYLAKDLGRNKVMFDGGYLK